MMRRKLILVLIVISALGLIVHCGGGSSTPSFPSLAGTWTGSAWVGDLPVGPRAASLEAVPQVILPPCPTIDGFADIELVMASDGTPTDLLICAQSVNDLLDTSVSAVVDQVDASENVLWVTFSAAATGSDLYAGGLVLDDSANYATVFFWDAITEEDIIFGVLQRTTEVLPFSEAAMVGSWSGITVDFEEIGDDIFYEKFSPLDMTLSDANSLAISGTDPDGFPFAGISSMADTVYGYFEGSIAAELDLSLEGFVSPDGEFFGGSVEEFDGSGLEWSIINMRKQ